MFEEFTTKEIMADYEFHEIDMIRNTFTVSCPLKMRVKLLTVMSGCGKNAIWI